MKILNKTRGGSLFKVKKYLYNFKLYNKLLYKAHLGEKKKEKKKGAGHILLKIKFISTK